MMASDTDGQSVRTILVWHFTILLSVLLSNRVFRHPWGKKKRGVERVHASSEWWR